MRNTIYSILFFVFLTNSLYAQNNEVEKLQGDINRINLLIKHYEDSIQFLMTKVETLQFEELGSKNTNYKTKVKYKVAIRNKPSIAGVKVCHVDKQDDITVIGFEKYYYVVNYGEFHGYLPTSAVYENEELQVFKNFVIQNEKQKKERENEEVYRQIEKEAIEKVEQEKLARKAEEEQRRIEKEKEQRALEQQREIRKDKLIEKYGPEVGYKIDLNLIWIGMTKEMAIDSKGRPYKNNRTVTEYGIHEQWVYNDNVYLYFEGDKLTKWQD